jgi:hypothetical protein
MHVQVPKDDTDATKTKHSCLYLTTPLTDAALNTAVSRFLTYDVEAISEGIGGLLHGGPHGLLADMDEPEPVLGSENEFLDNVIGFAIARELRAGLTLRDAIRAALEAHTELAPAECVPSDALKIHAAQYLEMVPVLDVPEFAARDAHIETCEACTLATSALVDALDPQFKAHNSPEERERQRVERERQQAPVLLARATTDADIDACVDSFMRNVDAIEFTEAISTLAHERPYECDVIYDRISKHLVGEMWTDAQAIMRPAVRAAYVAAVQKHCRVAEAGLHVAPPEIAALFACIAADAAEDDDGGHLPLEEHERVSIHLAMCEECRAIADQYEGGQS